MIEQGALAPLSLEQYCSTWRCHVEPRWGSVPVDRVRPLVIQQWLLTRRRVAAESSLHLLRQILDYATRYGFARENPAALRYLLPSNTTTTSREDGVWSPQELGNVWHACWGCWIEPAVLLAGFGGCRVGEALGVQGGDVRIEQVTGTSVAFVRIERQIDVRAREVNRTKNRWSRRTAMLAGRPAERLAKLADGCRVGEYLSHPPLSDVASQRELRRTFGECLEAHEVPAHLFKNLRKTWQTNARWALRLPPWIVEPLMGHVGSSVTAHHYDKPSEQVLAEVLVEAWREHPFGDSYEWLEMTADQRG